MEALIHAGFIHLSEQKIAAARAALAHVKDGMRIGVGTGSTAEEFIKLLGVAVANGLEIIGVPTSDRTLAMCTQHAIPMTTLNEIPQLDLTVDGADEIGPDLSLIKGGGGALLREKIVAFASKRMIVIADESKLVNMLGRFPLPIEVDRFGIESTKIAIMRAADKCGVAGTLEMRKKDGKAFITDGGHLLLDASFGRIPDAGTLAGALSALPGVVEHGLFIGLATMAFVAGPQGVRTLNSPKSTE